MGIHRLLLNHDQAHTFGNLWISLIKKHIGKFKSTPESFNFYEEIHGYFFYLEEFCDKKQLITEIDELLDSTTKRNHEGFANLLSIKAKYVRDLEGDSERSLRLLRESTWIVSQLKTFKNKKNYYANLLGIAMIYRVDLNDFEKALKWNHMLFLKIRRRMKKYFHKIGCQFTYMSSFLSYRKTQFWRSQNTDTYAERLLSVKYPQDSSVGFLR